MYNGYVQSLGKLFSIPDLIFPDSVLDEQEKLPKHGETEKEKSFLEAEDNNIEQVIVNKGT